MIVRAARSPAAGGPRSPLFVSSQEVHAGSCALNILLSRRVGIVICVALNCIVVYCKTKTGRRIDFPTSSLPALLTGPPKIVL